MKRRELLKRSLAAAGGVLVAAPAVLAGEKVQSFKGYTEVDPALFGKINRVQNPKGLTLLEKKHAPVIGLPERIASGEPFEVRVTVGEVVHPMSAAHYIQYVELLAGNEPAGRVEFRPGFNQPQVTFTLRLDRPVTLVAREYCNLHGLWESRVDVTPKG